MDIGSLFSIDTTGLKCSITAYSDGAPNKISTSWLKHHLQRLDAAVDLKQLNSLVEDNEMLAENLQHWAEKERMTGEQIGLQKGKKEMVISLIALGSMPDEQIAKVSGFSLEEIAALKKDGTH